MSIPEGLCSFFIVICDNYEVFQKQQDKFSLHVRMQW